MDRYVPWLDDALATSATGMRVTKRVMRTTNTMISYTPRAFIALTVRTPRFRREDVGERMLIFHLEKLHKKRPENEIQTEVARFRYLLLSDYARLLNEVVDTADPDYPEATIRLADFAKMAIRVGASLGLEEEARVAVEKLKKAQWLYATEEDDLYILLDNWLSRIPREQMDIGTGNRGRPVSPTTLSEELHEIADELGMKWRFSSPVSLGKHISAMEEPLSIYFKITKTHSKAGTVLTFDRVEG